VLVIELTAAVAIEPARIVSCLPEFSVHETAFLAELPFIEGEIFIRLS
jgi:hypothetical protein